MGGPAALERPGSLTALALRGPCAVAWQTLDDFALSLSTPAADMTELLEPVAQAPFLMFRARGGC